ncbi:FecR family protein [Pseudodonghicola flavimaris]|uniref:FecR family protein n=1 Tax=Pseudodonghicola flavimaris TaxID=3050036 RepID=A0ABT7F1E5_9RHOB|nr:FecR family protein [Pseudodonghicola flavimaris]MDK3018430.1 FecR family protein [Pseudodonghicola flavimaris]
MTDRNLLFACLAVLTLGLGAPVAAQSSEPRPGSPPGTCIVTRVDGPAIVSARGAGARPAEIGLGLGRNAKLRTRAGARVTLACAGGLEVVVGPDSEVDVVGLLDGGSRPLGLRLIDGIAGFLFASEDDHGVQVRTPSAVAAVRSTQWAMQVDRRASAIFTREGTVFVVTRSGDTRLGPGEGVDVARSGRLRPVTRWGQPRIDRLGALLGPDW